jgi:hypothetical protein
MRDHFLFKRVLNITPTIQPNIPNVRIYILCHNAERFIKARNKYRKYSWAVPIIMKYQDCTFENAFWKQLMELKHEWCNCDMVGTLSFTAHDKININYVNSVIKNKDTWKNGYYNFYETHKRITDDHPNLRTVIEDICVQLSIEEPTAAYCNYWMCTPIYMKQFIHWTTEKLIPAVISHPLAMTNAKYPGALSDKQLLQLCGVPYYPIIPFVIERLTKSFFMSLKPKVNL